MIESTSNPRTWPSSNRTAVVFPPLVVRRAPTTSKHRPCTSIDAAHRVIGIPSWSFRDGRVTMFPQPLVVLPAVAQASRRKAAVGIHARGAGSRTSSAPNLAVHVVQRGRECATATYAGDRPLHFRPGIRAERHQSGGEQDRRRFIWRVSPRHDPDCNGRHRHLAGRFDRVSVATWPGVNGLKPSPAWTTNPGLLLRPCSGRRRSVPPNDANQHSVKSQLSGMIAGSTIATKSSSSTSTTPQSVDA
jgi:hypothetical protein